MVQVPLAPNLSRLFAGMEEMSLKKQLPLRQTAQKPMLKYQPVAKQLQAYHQSETLYTHMKRKFKQFVCLLVFIGG
jgi:hypothetical protein